MHNLKIILNHKIFFIILMQSNFINTKFIRSYELIMTQSIGDWSEYLSKEKEKDYFISLYSFLNSRINSEIYPPRGEWFKAFEYSTFNFTKVIILGQDPYHGEGQAEGLSFSVPKDTTIPPSLRNIYKELESNNVNFSNPGHGKSCHLGQPRGSVT